MSFGYSTGDAIIVTQLAWRAVQNSRKACGEFAELTQQVSALHVVLQRFERSENLETGASRFGDRDPYKDELHAAIAGCQKVLRRLDSILKKYNSLAEQGEGRKVGGLWQKVRFGNGDMVDLGDLRGKIVYYTSLLNLLLNLRSTGSIGQIEQQMDDQGSQIRDIKAIVNGIAARQISKMSEEKSEASVLTAYMDDDKPVWREIRRELRNEHGFHDRDLRKHKALILNYISELGHRGVLDDNSPDGFNKDGGPATATSSTCSLQTATPQDVTWDYSCLPQDVISDSVLQKDSFGRDEALNQHRSNFLSAGDPDIPHVDEALEAASSDPDSLGAKVHDKSKSICRNQNTQITQSSECCNQDADDAGQYIDLEHHTEQGKSDSERESISLRLAKQLYESKYKPRCKMFLWSSIDKKSSRKIYSSLASDVLARVVLKVIQVHLLGCIGILDVPKAVFIAKCRTYLSRLEKAAAEKNREMLDRTGEELYNFVKPLATPIRRDAVQVSDNMIAGVESLELVTKFTWIQSHLSRALVYLEGKSSFEYTTYIELPTNSVQRNMIIRLFLRFVRNREIWERLEESNTDTISVIGRSSFIKERVKMTYYDARCYHSLASVLQQMFRSFHSNDDGCILCRHGKVALERLINTVQVCHICCRRLAIIWFASAEILPDERVKSNVILLIGMLAESDYVVRNWLKMKCFEFSKRYPRRCPGRNCQSVIDPEHCTFGATGRSLWLFAQCPSCWTVACFRCGKLWHGGKDCARDPAENAFPMASSAWESIRIRM